MDNVALDMEKHLFVQPYQFPVRGRKLSTVLEARFGLLLYRPTLPIPRQGTETMIPNR